MSHLLRSHRQNDRKGFTLLELIVTIVILGILAAIAIPTFLSVITNTKIHTEQVTAAAVVEDAYTIAKVNGEDAPSTADFAQAVSETGPNAAGGDGTLAAGASTFTLTNSGNPLLPSSSYGSVSAATSDDGASAPTPTATGIAFESSVSGWAIFAYSSAPGNVETWALQCPDASSLVAQLDEQNECTATTSDPPGAPSDVTATVTGSDSETVTWSPPSSGTPAYYTVSWPGGSESFPGTDTSVTVPTTGPVTVTAVGVTDGASAPSGSSTTVTSAPPSPGSPTISYTCGSTVGINWSAPSDTGSSSITSYTVSDSQGDKWTTAGSQTSLSITSLTNGDSYSFTVSATNAAGTGPSSGSSNTITLAACDSGDSSGSGGSSGSSSTPTQTVLGFSGLTWPGAVAVDSSTGDVYVANGDGTVVELTPGGIQTVLPFTGLECPSGVAVDPTTHDVYVSDTCNLDVVKLTPGGVQTVVPLTGVTSAYAIAEDSANGNIYVADGSGVLQLTPGGVQTTLPFSGLNSYGTDVAVNSANGDVYTQGNTTGSSASVVVQLTPGGVQTVLGLSDLSWPEVGSLAVNSSTGDVYLAGTTNSNLFAPGAVDIVQMTPGGVQTVLPFSDVAWTGSPEDGITFPSGIAVDSADGYVYEVDLYNNDVVQLS